jgi:hypothetical protein
MTSDSAYLRLLGSLSFVGNLCGSGVWIYGRRIGVVPNQYELHYGSILQDLVVFHYTLGITKAMVLQCRVATSVH